MVKTYQLIFLLCTIVLLFTGARYVSLGSDITSFIVAGDRSVDRDVHPYPIKIATNSQGYDGQKFYHLALNPFDTKAYEFGIRTNLSYRKQRILYPLTAHILALGNHIIVPAAMVVVNVICFLFYLMIVAKFFKTANLIPSSIILFACLPALYIALSRDLAEVMGLMFLVLTLFQAYKKQYLFFFIAASCAILTREESILVIFPISAFLFLTSWKSKFGYRNLLFASLPGVVFLVWKSWIYLTYGSYDNILVSIPFSGLIAGFQENFQISFSADRASIVNMLFPFYCLYILLWYIVTAIYASRYLRFKEVSYTSMLSYAWVLWTCFLSFLPNIVYNEELSFARVLSVYGLLSLLLIVLHTKPPKWYYLFSVSMISLIMIRLVMYP